MAVQSHTQLAIISKLQAQTSSLLASLAKEAAKTQAAEASICKLEEDKAATEGLLALAEARGRASIMRADLAEADAAAILLTLAQAGAAEEIAKKKAANALVEIASSKADLSAAEVLVAKERAKREEAEALLSKAHQVILDLEKEALAMLVRPANDGPVMAAALESIEKRTAVVLLCEKKEKKAKRGKKGQKKKEAAAAVLGKVFLPSLKSPAKAILLLDSAIDLAEPRSVPASRRQIEDLSNLCWCDEGWNCMCGLPDGP